MDLIKEEMKNFIREALKPIIEDIGSKFREFDKRLLILEKEISQIKEQLNLSSSNIQIPDVSVLESSNQKSDTQITPTKQLTSFLGKKEDEKMIAQPLKKPSEIKDLLDALKVIDNL